VGLFPQYVDISRNSLIAYEKNTRSLPYCASRSVTRRGTRKKKLEVVQLWRCGSCKRVFTPAPDALRHKTYPCALILEAITDYNLGYSLADTAARLKSKRGLRVSPSTIASWLDEHRSLTSYRRLRDRGKSLFAPNTTIRAIKLYHRQVYEYAYHRGKLEFVRDGTLDDKRSGSTQFAKLADFWKRFRRCRTNCSRDSEARASQLKSELFDPHHVVVNRKDNAATRAAAFVYAVTSAYQIPVADCCRHGAGRNTSAAARALHCLCD